MTDKQIIFGVDVSKCPYAEPAYGSPKCRINGYVHCDGFRNCEYKQLKRKNQRIVELNKTIKAKEQECERLKHDNGYEVGALERTIENLKAENDELERELRQKKMTILMNNDHYFEVDKKNRQLKQTLTEIKEIAEDKSYIGFWDEQISLILDKISEVEK